MRLYTPGTRRSRVASNFRSFTPFAGPHSTHSPLVVEVKMFLQGITTAGDVATLQAGVSLAVLMVVTMACQRVLLLVGLAANLALELGQVFGRHVGEFPDVVRFRLVVSLGGT